MLGAVLERPPLRTPMQYRGARGLPAAVAGGMTGWRQCCECIDGPVTTGPYQGRRVRQDRRAFAGTNCAAGPQAIASGRLSDPAAQLAKARALAVHQEADAVEACGEADGNPAADGDAQEGQDDLVPRDLGDAPSARER